MTNALLGSVDQLRSGVASGTPNMARQAGSVLGVAVLGSLVATGDFTAGLHMDLALCIAFVVVGAVVTGRSA